jgi:hypothetical protein
MPRTTVEALRQQSKECLEASRRTDDKAVRDELLTAAVWLHEEAIRIEKLLSGPQGGGGPGSTGKGQKKRDRVPPLWHMPPRYSQPRARITA